MKERDRNSTFFHRLAMKYMKRNSINSLMNDDNQTIIDDIMWGEMATRYFYNTYKEESSISQPALEDQLLECIPRSLTLVNNAQSLTPVTNEEVKAFTFSIGAFKALGPDGFPMTFLQELQILWGLT